ncbi:AAA family ATPase [Faecalitalea cylindroides]|uniref:AAA family ATPase n=1 Tax=Faecalitalea cylindroides TaxID=39483 RepID=UPI00232AC9B1|nr:AAA family ATPase [Faecalitalea cylindroides]MDB7952377.1 AAA family ATPase [Faecalitalea cylindroides]MDB7958995.1 AAA family ATPase [Faecalitalea cylindroides]MDB7960828.1 AAA family ATPase [Faecalitalea cylindroides]MDB7962923.1 AAA family ATPase [Faecalitalea cylindroides]MDB7964768.1 AAA family ATPase [Faecalitalea cylindroides]
MKHVYLIGGPMGIGKSTICNQLNQDLDHSVFLDGDWCWNMDPFMVNQDTKNMVLDNITHCLNNFIHTPGIENIIFCWVMHKQDIIDQIIQKLDTEGADIHLISLICEKEELIKRMLIDRRDNQSIRKSLQYLELYKDLDTKKIDVTTLDVQKTIDKIKR